MKNIATLDQALGRAAKLLRILREEGLSEEALHWPINNPSFRKKLVEFWRKGSDLCKPEIGRYIVTINYAGDKTIKNLLKEGKYDWVNNDITDKHFPTKKTGTEKEEIYFIHFNKRFDNGNQVIEELGKLGYKSANPAQLLALGAKHPDLQRQFPIAALGQHWFGSGGFRFVVYLSRYLGDRSAGLYWFKNRWSVDWRFAVVPK